MLCYFSTFARVRISKAFEIGSKKIPFIRWQHDKRNHIRLASTLASGPKTPMRRSMTPYILALFPIISFGLGTWQVYRLQWKQELIKNVKKALANEPRIFNQELMKAWRMPKHGGIQEYQRVLVAGVFGDQEVLVGPKMRDGQVGYNVITPLTTAEGNSIIVNRGFIKRENRDLFEARKPPKEVVYIEGQLKDSEPTNYFTPLNEPQRGVWYNAVVEDLAKVLRTEPVMICSVSSIKIFFKNSFNIIFVDSNGHYQGDSEVEAVRCLESGIPHAAPQEVKIKNNHLQYIITWYSLSALTAFITFSKFRKGVVRRV